MSIRFSSRKGNLNVIYFFEIYRILIHALTGHSVVACFKVSGTFGVLTVFYFNLEINGINHIDATLQYHSIVVCAM